MAVRFFILRGDDGNIGDIILVVKITVQDVDASVLRDADCSSLLNIALRFAK